MNIGVDANNVRNTDMVNPFYGQYSETTGVGGLISVSTQRTFSVNQQYLLTYNKTFDDVHNLDVLAGHENYNYKYQYLYGQRENCITRMSRNWIMVFQISIIHLIQKIMRLKVGCSAFSYDYDGKYFGSASYRRDASSAFHPDNRWGNFWSAGAAWLISKENFFQNNDALKFIDMLKIKASYGSQGNDNIADIYETPRYTNTYDIVNSSGHPASVPKYWGTKILLGKQMEISMPVLTLKCSKAVLAVHSNSSIARLPICYSHFHCLLPMVIHLIMPISAICETEVLN